LRPSAILAARGQRKAFGFPTIPNGTRFDKRFCFEVHMFIDEMVNQGATPAIEQTLKFTTARQRLLEEDVANISTPGYVQKDLSVAKFQQVLRERLAAADEGPRGQDLGSLGVDVENPRDSIMFHDGNNRSVEELMSAGMKNALTHNLMIELLKKQFATMELALQQK
jgi:flagellar basal-body rod protein FlgB